MNVALPLPISAGVRLSYLSYCRPPASYICGSATILFLLLSPSRFLYLRERDYFISPIVALPLLISAAVRLFYFSYCHPPASYYDILSRFQRHPPIKKINRAIP